MSNTRPPDARTIIPEEIGVLTESLSPEELAELGLRGETPPTLDQTAEDERGAAVGSPIAQSSSAEAATPEAVSPTGSRSGGPAGPPPASRVTEARPVQFAPLVDTNTSTTRNTIDLLLDVELKLAAELGQTRLTIRRILELGAGSIVELDRLAGEPVDITINNTLIAKGEVVVVDDKFGIRILDIVSPARRVSSFM